MKGHETVVAAAPGSPPPATDSIWSSWAQPSRVRGLVETAGLADRVSFVGFFDDLPR
jgi:hypothetical protein